MGARGRELEDRTIVVTREEGARGPLSLELQSRGAHVLLWPTVRSLPPEDPGPLETGVQDLDSYDWVAFTSARAVHAVIERRPKPPASLRIAAVGAATARVLGEAGWRVDLEPEESSSLALVDALRREVCEGDRIFFPASSLARRSLARGLSERGAVVDEVIAYRTESVPLPAEAVRTIEEVLSQEGNPGSSDGPVDAVCFASPSAVRGWSESFGAEPFSDLGRTLLIASIGDTTAEALRGAGCLNLVVAAEHSFAGLADAIADAFTRTTKN